MTAAVKDVVARMASDPQFARRLQDDPDGVAAEYGLDAAQVAALAGAKVDTRARTHQRLEERLSRSALVFGGDMGTDSGDSGSDSGDSGSDSGDSRSDSGDSGSDSGGDSGGDSDDSGGSSRDESRDDSSSESRTREPVRDDDADGRQSRADTAERDDPTREPQRTEPQQTGTQPNGAQAPAATASVPAAPEMPTAGTLPSAVGPVADPSAPLSLDVPDTQDEWADLLRPAWETDEPETGPDAPEAAQPSDGRPSFAAGEPHPGVLDVLLGDDDDTVDSGDREDTDSGDGTDDPDRSAPEQALDTASDVADTGIAGPVMAPSSIGAPANSPLGYPQSGQDPNGTYHGGQVKEQTVGRTPTGGLVNHVTYGDGTTAERTVEVRPDPQGRGDSVLEKEVRSDGSRVDTLHANGAGTSDIVEPDGTTISRNWDGVSFLSDEALDPQGGRDLVTWSGASSDPQPGSLLFSVEGTDPDGSSEGVVSVSATADGGAVATSIDDDGRMVVARVDVSDVENDDGSVSRVYLFPDGRTETFTFDWRGAPVSHESQPPLPGEGDRPPLQEPVPAAADHHGGVIGDQPLEVLDDGSTTHLVTYADGTAVDVTRTIEVDGTTTDRWVDDDGTSRVHVYGNGRTTTFATDPGGITTSVDSDFRTLHSEVTQPDQSAVATDWLVTGEPRRGQELFTTRSFDADGVEGDVTIVTAGLDGTATAFLLSPDGTQEQVRVDVDEVENIDGSLTRIYAFPDGRTESFTFDAAGAPIGHQAFDAPGPPDVPSPDDLVPDQIDPDLEPTRDDLRHVLDDLLGDDGRGVPGETVGRITDLLQGALAPGPDGEPATGPLADLARLLGGSSPNEDGGASGETGALDGDSGEAGDDGADDRVVETRELDDGARQTLTTLADGTTTDVVTAVDGTTAMIMNDPTGRSVITDSAADGSLARTVVHPDGTRAAETRMPDGSRAVAATDDRGRDAGLEVFPDGTTRATLLDPATGTSTERTTTPGIATTLTTNRPDGTSESTTRFVDGTTQSAETGPAGGLVRTTEFPAGEVEVDETDPATGERTITRSSPSGFVSTDRVDPTDGTVTRTSGFPGEATTVERLGPAGEALAREVFGPDGEPLGAAGLEGLPRDVADGLPGLPDLSDLGDGLDLPAAGDLPGLLGGLADGLPSVDSLPGIDDLPGTDDLPGLGGLLPTDSWTAAFDESWGIGGTLGGSTEWGPLTASGSLTGFVGVQVGGFATGGLGPDGLSGAVGLDASFGASGTAAGALGLGPAEISALLGASADGHLGLGAEGSIGLDGISVGAELDAYLGAMAGGGGEAELLGVGGKLGGEVGVGLGVSLDADASLSLDEVGFEFEVGAMLGIGGSFSFGLSISPSEIVDGIGGVITDPLGAAEDVGEFVWEDVGGTVVDVGEFVWEDVGGGLLDVGDSIGDVGGDLLEGIGDVGGDLLEGIGDIGGDALDGIGGALEDIGGGVGDAVEAVGDFFSDLF